MAFAVTCMGGMFLMLLCVFIVLIVCFNGAVDLVEMIIDMGETATNGLIVLQDWVPKAIIILMLVLLGIGVCWTGYISGEFLYNWLCMNIIKV